MARRSYLFICTYSINACQVYPVLCLNSGPFYQLSLCNIWGNVFTVYLFITWWLCEYLTSPCHQQIGNLHFSMFKIGSWKWFGLLSYALGNCHCKMTSSNGNIFRVTGPLCGEFTSPGEFPIQRPITRSFDVFFYLRLNKPLSNNREAGDLRRYCAHYDVIVMIWLVHVRISVLIRYPCQGSSAIDIPKIISIAPNLLCLHIPWDKSV